MPEDYVELVKQLIGHAIRDWQNWLVGCIYVKKPGLAGIRSFVPVN